MSQALSSVQYIASGRAHVRTWRRQTWFLPRAPSNLVTPLESGYSSSSKYLEIFETVVIRRSMSWLPVFVQHEGMKVEMLKYCW